MNWKLRSTVVPMVAATGLVVAMGAGTAFADDAATTSNVAALPTDGYVTAAATRAAQPAPEILGLSGVEETNNSWYDVTQRLNSLDWSAPKYYLMANLTYNISPNPYFYNYLFDTSGKQVVINPSRSGKMGPRASLGTYGEDQTDDDVWNMLPDVVIGTMAKTGTADYSSDAYAGAISEAKGVTYNPVGIDYVMNTNAGFINDMYNIASAADQIVASSNGTKQLRYGNATEIAKQYEEYIRGTQGYVLAELAANGEDQKVVASVNSYDPTTGTYKIIASGYSEGTASTNRYLEAAEAVSVNLIDELKLTVDGNGLATCTAEQLAQADLVLVGCQSDNSSKEDLANVSDILGTMDSEQKAKCYYVTDANNSAGSMYGVTMNSVENAQNIGRILGCLYPEYIDQDDWICYYYDNFYHIKSNKLAEAVDNAMDGVRNWDASGADAEATATSWTVEDASTYNEADVQAKINRGIAYLQSQGAEATGAVLTPTDNIEKASYDISTSSEEATVTVDSIETQTYTGAAVTPKVVVRYNGDKLVEGTEYEVSYVNNEAAGKATAVVKGKGAYAGTIIVSFDIAEATTVYRMYNPITSEHLWTTDVNEYNDLVNHDWKKEDVAWTTSATGKGVYRLYNAALGAMGKMSHHYTTDKAEADKLVAENGWVYDNGGQPIFYSAEDESGAFEGASPVYRLYNDGLSAHHLTLDQDENDSLIKDHGWTGEGTGFYAYKQQKQEDSGSDSDKLVD